MMKKDYVLIAREIRETKEKWWHDADVPLHHLARHLATVFERDNARFDRAKFIEACGFDSSEVELIEL